MVRKWIVFLALCGYTVWTILNHEVVQGWLGPLVEQMGRPLFYLVAGVSCAGAGLGLSWLLWQRTKDEPKGSSLRQAWVLSLLGSGVAAYLLTVNNSEFAHFLQYAIFGFITYWLTRHMGETIAWATLAGAADEGYQYFVLHAGWGIPWDFNDVVLNLFGAAIGAILGASYWSRSGERWWKRPGIIVLCLAYATLLLLLAVGRVTLYEDKSVVTAWFSLSRLRLPGFWFFDATWGPRRIHMLSPVEGPLLLAALVAAYLQLDRVKELSK